MDTASPLEPNRSSWEESLRFYNSARQVMLGDDYRQAIGLFEQSIALFPHHKSLTLLGECYVSEKRLNDAVVVFAAATTLNKSGVAPAWLAEVWLKLGEFNLAKDMVELAIERQPHFKRAITLRNTIEAVLRDLNETVSDSDS